MPGNFDTLAGIGDEPLDAERGAERADTGATGVSCDFVMLAGVRDKPLDAELGVEYDTGARADIFGRTTGLDVLGVVGKDTPDGDALRGADARKKRLRVLGGGLPGDATDR